MKRVLGVSGCAVCNVLRALCSEGALCTGALCAGAVPAVLPSEHSIVFMCARTHKGHIVPWSCSCSQLASAVLRGRTVYGRPVRWRCACRTALGAFDCVYVCAYTQRPHRAHGRVRARSLRARATPASGLCSCSRGVRAQATPAYWSLLCGPSGMKPSSEDVRRLGWDAMFATAWHVSCRILMGVAVLRQLARRHDERAERCIVSHPFENAGQAVVRHRRLPCPARFVYLQP